MKRAASISAPTDLEPVLDLREQLLVGLGQRTRLGHDSEVLERALECAVDEVSPGRDQLVVVAADELGPGEVRVLRLRAGDREEVAQRVRVVAAEEVPDQDLDAPGWS